MKFEQYAKHLESKKEMQYLRFHDSLTGLYNHTYLNELLNSNKDLKFQAVFIFSIDRLKDVNDNFGHAEGDKLIVSAANVLKKCIRDTDIVLRIEGDEFLAIISDVDEKICKIIKQRIDKAIAANNNSVEPHLVLSLSMGFVVAENDTDSLERVLNKASKVMNENKISRHNLPINIK